MEVANQKNRRGRASEFECRETVPKPMCSRPSIKPVTQLVTDGRVTGRVTGRATGRATRSAIGAETWNVSMSQQHCLSVALIPWDSVGTHRAPVPEQFPII
jgi:hypothetical protein